MVKTTNPICVICGNPHPRKQLKGRNEGDHQSFLLFCEEVLNLGDGNGLENLPDDLPICEDCINSFKVIIHDRRLAMAAWRRVNELLPQSRMMVGELTTLKRLTSWVLMDSKVITELVNNSGLPMDGNAVMERVRQEMLKVEPAFTAYNEELSRLDSAKELQRFLVNPEPFKISTTATPSVAPNNDVVDADHRNESSSDGHSLKQVQGEGNIPSTKATQKGHDQDCPVVEILQLLTRTTNES